MNKRHATALLFGALLPLVVPKAAMAQAYPSRPLHFVVNFPPGGASDTIARLFGQEIGGILSQIVLIENKPGAGGAIGMVYAAKQPADGYTFTMGTLGSSIVQPLIRSTPYDMVRDFDPVALIATGPAVLVVNPASPFKSLADIVAAAKAKPGTLNFGSGGVGTFAHLTGEMLNQAAGIKIVHVPYKGGVQALTDVLANQLDMIAVDPPSALPQIRAGKLRAIATTGAQRSTLLPDVPTFAESGYKDLVGANSWSIWMPKGAPPARRRDFPQRPEQDHGEPDLAREVRRARRRPDRVNARGTSEVRRQRVGALRQGHQGPGTPYRVRSP